jgi:hypothetical protein
MVPFFPKQVSFRGIIVYLISLGFISLFFWNYAMGMIYVVLGVVWVTGFFLLTSQWSRNWCMISEKQYLAYCLSVAFLLRIVWVVASYYYYRKMTGVPFEFEAADSLGYHEEALWLASEDWLVAMDYYFGPLATGISDVGYPLYLTFLYKVFGPVIIVPRIIKAVLSTFTCYLLYKLAGRTFGEETGRMAGIMCALMPNLVIYCGYHLKETEMLFLEVAFLERLDYLFRNKRTNVIDILIPLLLIGSLAFFRTVLSTAALFAAVTGVVLSTTPAMSKGWKRTELIGWVVLGLIALKGGTAMTEIEAYWEEREENVVDKREHQTSQGNQWAQYATGSVMAPMMFVLPFSTMVDVDQQFLQQTKHGGNYIRNFMGFFVFLAIIEAFRRNKWRDFAMIGAFAIAYLGVVSLSGFSNSERFLLPGLPVLIMIWAYGVSTLSRESLKLLTPWCIVVFIMEFGWAYFKLGSRGLF